jgi:hypothetical protein
MLVCAASWQLANYCTTLYLTSVLHHQADTYHQTKNKVMAVYHHYNII